MKTLNRPLSAIYRWFKVLVTLCIWQLQGMGNIDDNNNNNYNDNYINNNNNNNNNNDNDNDNNNDNNDDDNNLYFTRVALRFKDYNFHASGHRYGFLNDERDVAIFIFKDKEFNLFGPCILV